MRSYHGKKTIKKCGHADTKLCYDCNLKSEIWIIMLLGNKSNSTIYDDV